MTARRRAAGQAHRDLDGERCGARGRRRAEAADPVDLCERAIFELGAVARRRLDHQANLDKGLR